MASSHIYCTICSAVNQPENTFCFACGQPLQADISFTQYSTPEPGRGTSTRFLIPNRLLKQRYRILKELGRGGFGAVYKAEDSQFGNRLVAVKEMSLNGPNSRQEVDEAVKNFEREALMLAGLRHQNLPRIYDHLFDGGRWYLVMDYIEGETLKERLARSGRRLSIEETMRIGIQLCAVLDYLHTRQLPIIFRDLKPSNVILTPDGHLYLIDFGIAHHFKPEQVKDTMAVGSPGYAAPEQWGKATTPRSDIYSLGATLHQMLTGENPSDRPFHFAPPQFPGQPALSVLSSLIVQMVDMDESKRPASMATVRQMLQQIVTQLAAPRPLTPRPLMATESPSLILAWRRKSPFAIASGIAVVILIGTFLISAVWTFSHRLSSSQANIAATSKPGPTATQHIPTPTLASTPTPIPPTPTPTPQPQNDSYEAESSVNTLIGNAALQDCPGCSGSKKVGEIGPPPSGGALQFNEIQANSSGPYTLTIYYCSGEMRFAFMSVNDGPATVLTFTSTGSFLTVGALQTGINLNAGSNTIKFYNNAGWTPDFDKITVRTGAYTHNGPVSYEAESPANALIGSAGLQSCSGCSGGQKVGEIGPPPSGGALQFNDVNVNASGTYTMTIYYCSGDSRSAFMNINGGPDTMLTFASTGSYLTVGTLQIRVHLNTGNNTIKFYNNASWAPDFDKITIDK